MVSEIWVPQSLAQVLHDVTNVWPMGQPIWGKWANNHGVAQIQGYTSPRNSTWGKSIQQFQRYAIHKVWTQFVPNLTGFWPMGKCIWGKWTDCDASAQLKALTIPQNFEWRESVKRLQRYGFRKSGRRLPARTVTAIPSSPEGWGVKIVDKGQ